MRIERTAAPGNGAALHHIVARFGGRFRVWIDPDGNRCLSIYDDLGLDTPTVVLQPDEANQLADLLHDRSTCPSPSCCGNHRSTS